MKKIAIISIFVLIYQISYGQTNILLSGDTIVYTIERENFIWFDSDSLSMISIDEKKQKKSLYSNSKKIMYIKAGEESYSLTGAGNINGLNGILSISFDNINVNCDNVSNLIKIFPSTPGTKILFETKMKPRYKKKNATNIYIKTQ